MNQMDVYSLAVRRACRRYERRSQVNTVHNARIQLLANAMNTIAVALIVTGFVVPIVSGQILGGVRLVVAISWIWPGVGLHIAAQMVLGKLRP